MSTSSPQHWDPARYAGHARFVSDLGLPVIALLSPRPGERVLDLGCGDGVLARSLMDRGCEVVGVDASPAMVAAARSQGVDARVADGQCLSFDESFDAVFSNAALHWMQHPVAVIEGVWRALKPGGRFVAEFGGEGNIAAIVAALESALAERELSIPSPWFFPSPETYRSLLEARGFEIGDISLFARPTELPGDVGHWLDIFAQPYLAAVAPADRAAVVAEVVERLRPALRRGDGRWVADYVRLQFAATKPASAG